MKTVNISLLLLLLATLNISSSIAGNWNILSQKPRQKGALLDITLRNYCEAWRINVELNNIRDFVVVPNECTDFVRKYVTSIQYEIDSQRAIDEATVFISTNIGLKKDGKDAWIFDIDDTLLSTVPYYKKHQFGGEKLNKTDLEEWMSKGNAPAITSSLKLFNDLKGRGVQIFLLSSRREILRSATIDNLVDVGYYGWTNLILRGEGDEDKSAEEYKTGIRKQLNRVGYRIWGIVGDQWSSLNGFPSAKRTFKLPNPLYFVA
ncbi:acid phosphatase 1-like [Impatiens glandulifera]|uniref:acid phosphatase 1-like n=1 Tax=Impatiens glandulifera TaxID=253017 RepID=UPI001FB074D5|nr:acid phosphatase 1-like [Impatiens glandulifera]